MNWKALLHTLTASLVGAGLNWGATSLIPAAGPWGGLVAAALSVGVAFAAKSPWTSPNIIGGTNDAPTNSVAK
jgi:hypothetical protein